MDTPLRQSQMSVYCNALQKATRVPKCNITISKNVGKFLHNTPYIKINNACCYIPKQLAVLSILHVIHELNIFCFPLLQFWHCSMLQNCLITTKKMGYIAKLGQDHWLLCPYCTQPKGNIQLAVIVCEHMEWYSPKCSQQLRQTYS